MDQAAAARLADWMQTEGKQAPVPLAGAGGPA
jgi:hypothetical protein